MSHTGNDFALSYRDKIIGHSVKAEKASLNYQKGNYFMAAMFDFSGNLFLGAIPQTLMGFGIVIPYFTVSKQGWVGGYVNTEFKKQV